MARKRRQSHFSATVWTGGRGLKRIVWRKAVGANEIKLKLFYVSFTSDARTCVKTKLKLNS